MHVALELRADLAGHVLEHGEGRAKVTIEADVVGDGISRRPAVILHDADNLALADCRVLLEGVALG